MGGLRLGSGAGRFQQKERTKDCHIELDVLDLRTLNASTSPTWSLVLQSPPAISFVACRVVQEYSYSTR